MKFRPLLPFCIIVALLTSICLHAQYSEATKADFEKALVECADYVSTVVLDDEGKSRCDYNMTEGVWYPYEIPWHTGQAILGLLSAFEITQDSTYLKKAIQGGDYWAGLQIKEGPIKGMLNAVHGDALGDEFIVFATVSDGTPGIYELSKVTKDKKYASVATSAASWLMNNTYYEEEGVCYDVIHPSGKVLKQNSPFWKDLENRQSLFHVSRPNTEGSLFLDAYDFTGDKAFKDAFINLCNRLVELQGPEGLWMQFMPNHNDVKSFHPRFNIWYAESLIRAFEATNDRKYLEAAAKTARVYQKAQKADGTIYYKNYIDGKASDRGSICGSSVAFSGILWMKLAQYGYDEFNDSIALSANWLLKNRFKSDHPDVNLAGAVMNTRVRYKRENKIWFVNRDVGTSFALRFFTDYIKYKFD